jgi:hypothetical protein
MRAGTSRSPYQSQCRVSTPAQWRLTVEMEGIYVHSRRSAVTHSTVTVADCRRFTAARLPSWQMYFKKGPVGTQAPTDVGAAKTRRGIRSSGVFGARGLATVRAVSEVIHCHWPPHRVL